MTVVNSNKTLAYDLSLFSADARLRRNILSVRAASTSNDAFINENGLVVPSNDSVSIPDIGTVFGVVIYSSQPITITATLSANNTNTVLNNQTLFVMTDNISSILLSNPGSTDALVNVIRLAQTTASSNYRIPRHLVTFPALSRIAPIGYSVTTLSKVQVQDVTLASFTNDQVTAPGTGSGVFQKFRICDSSGNPSSTGSYIMLLDDTVTQQNFSGTLQLWVAELM